MASDRDHNLPRAAAHVRRPEVLKDVERLGRAVKKQREEIEVLAREARARWGLAYVFFTLVVTMTSLLLLRAWTWLFPRW